MLVVSFLALRACISFCIAISCAPYRIQNPLIPKIHPKIHPESSPETKVRTNYEKYTKTPRFLYIFRNFFRILVSGGDSGCILGCILGIRGVLYSVRGTGDRKFCSVSDKSGAFLFFALFATKRVVVPALLQKLVGDYFLLFAGSFGGKLARCLRTHKI